MNRTRSLLLLALLVAPFAFAQTSTPIAEVLRQPLPSEDLTLRSGGGAISIEGPTFRYGVDAGSGAIMAMQAVRAGDVVAALEGPADVSIDGRKLSECTGGATVVLLETKGQIVLATKGTWGDGIDYTLTQTFYNDGVVVSEFVLTPASDVALRSGIRHDANAAGRFTQYLHKRRDTNGMDSYQGALPEAGTQVPLTTLTSCLEVFSPEAAFAVFTDRGGTYRSADSLETASLRVNAKHGKHASVALTQHIAHVGPDGAQFVLPAGEPFTFRTGLAVAPNRHQPARMRDLRMFIWIGDGKNPYPTDDEIRAAARLGFTLFQMHRLGTPGEPRPPEAEFDRVLKTVHDAGMLFIWTANADLMYRNAPKVAELVAAGQWAQWEGFNYGGEYKATMDPFCDTLATCLASPNGLADYRIETVNQMLERYPVDGMYIDDNLPYANCTLWKEHGHPEPVYDCLIELHDVSWRRRQAMLAKCPHAVLIDHCSQGFILPTIAAFDAHLFAEGYSFPSIEAYWDTFGKFRGMPGQGCLWAGDSETTRCNAEIAYAFDLLTGGGQYSYLDWRLWPEKFPYASGVQPEEVLFVKAYNLAQYYFGMYESDCTYFDSDKVDTSAPGTYATIYKNKVWGDTLIALANMKGEETETTLTLDESLLPKPEAWGAASDGGRRHEAFTLAPGEMRLLNLRAQPAGPVYHQYGGKRISEQWDDSSRTLSLQLLGPQGLEDTVVLATDGVAVKEVFVDGAPATFFADPDSGTVHGAVVFAREPITLRVRCAEGNETSLTSRALEPSELTRFLERRRQGG